MRTVSLACAMLGVVSAIVARPSRGPVQSEVTRSILPLEVMVLSQPQLAQAGGQWYIVYELHATNFYSVPVTLREVTVLDTVKSIRRYSAADLDVNLKVIGPRDTSPATRLLPGRRAVLFVWAAVPSPDRAPTSIRHRVVATIGASADSQVITGGAAMVSPRLPVVLDPPVKGDGWISYYGPCPTAVPSHDHLYISVQARSPFRSDSRSTGSSSGPPAAFHGDSAHNDNYYAYRQPVHAVGDGVVEVTINDDEENTPPEPPARLTRHSVAGNVVVLSVGRERHAGYGHLRPGSVRIAQGQRVRRGDVIGEVGNTGNLTAPHLHFHLIDAPSTGAGEGLAVLFGKYELIDSTPIAESVLDNGEAWHPAPWVGVSKTSDRPTCGSVVRLP